MVDLVTRVKDLTTRAASESKSLRTLINGNVATLVGLTTTVKTDLVSAINEVRSTVTTLIDDTQTTSAVKTYSVTKINAAIAAAVASLKTFFGADANGKVGAAATADAVAWTGVTGKPTTYAPAAHDASLVSSGVFDPARIPVLRSDKAVISTGDLTALTTAQQLEVESGTTVTTTDGRRWIYTGTGTKTLAASYIEMADVTPDWTVIANKPTTLVGYGISDAQAKDATLTALAGLTTAADQMIYTIGADAAAMTSLTAFARTVLDDADGPAVCATIGAATSAAVGTTDTDFVALFNTSVAS